MASQALGRGVIKTLQERATVLPRDLHPGAWWIWALGLAAAVSTMVNPVLIGLVVLVACFVVVARRTEAPWAMSFRLYLCLGLLVVVIRVVFRIVFGGDGGGPVAFTLPSIPLPDFAAGITLLGPVTRDALLAALYDGMRLAAII
ncbi:MAG: energy-coupling factor transporter transmembrane protein EcfT, partial [Aeromicrobium sp.]